MDRWVRGHRKLDVTGAWGKPERAPGPQPPGRPRDHDSDADTVSGGESPDRAKDKVPKPHPKGRATAPPPPEGAGRAPSEASSSGRQSRPRSPGARQSSSEPPPRKQKGRKGTALDRMVAAGKPPPPE